MSAPSPLDSALLKFRPLTKADVPMLYRWFNLPHAQRWFGKSLDEILEEYIPYIDGTVPVFPHIVSFDGRDIGLINWERFEHFPEQHRLYGIDEADVMNVDVIIGEPDVVHRGLGAPLILKFLREYVFSDPRNKVCIIDPEVENVSAIRAYAKAGFKHVRTMPDDGEGKPIYLMELRREDLGLSLSAGRE